MKNLNTAVIERDGDWWIGWIEEVPGVNCQEATREELLETLRITLQEALEFDQQEVFLTAREIQPEEDSSNLNTEFLTIIEKAREEFRKGKKLSLEEMKREVLE